MNPIQKSTLQIEFKTRQQMNRFVRFLKKQKNLEQYIDGKGENTVFLCFDSETMRQRVKQVILKGITNIEVITYNSGIDKLKVV
jgi:hypothetical protein